VINSYIDARDATGLYRPLVDDLEKVGFKLNYGIDGTYCKSVFSSPGYHLREAAFFLLFAFPLFDDALPPALAEPDALASA
jgi:hypothetical protein